MDKILIVDDHAVAREDTRWILEQEQDLGVLAEVGDGQQAMWLATWQRAFAVVNQLMSFGRYTQESRHLSSLSEDCYLMLQDNLDRA